MRSKDADGTVAERRVNGREVIGGPDIRVSDGLLSRFYLFSDQR